MIPAVPHFHRQRFVLVLLDYAGGELTKMDLHKLLFYFQKIHSLRHFSFIPYKYGCFSFQLQSDLDLLKKRNWIELKGNKILLNYPAQRVVSSNYEDALRTFFQKKGTPRGKNLVKLIYSDYPWWAINSKIAEKIMSKEELEIINQNKKIKYNEEYSLFTIGYEGIHFEEYLNKLILNKIELLVDVRKNPYSRKFGFSKDTLSAILPKLGIKYLSIPELGVENHKRKNLKTKSDYTILFKDYSEDLMSRKLHIDRIVEDLEENKRIALTCFEADPVYCHRHCLSDYIWKNHKIIPKHL
ncbi:MAG: DUF488 family protein [Myxococcota bacterium]